MTTEPLERTRTRL